MRTAPFHERGKDYTTSKAARKHACVCGACFRTNIVVLVSNMPKREGDLKHSVVKNNRQVLTEIGCKASFHVGHVGVAIGTESIGSIKRPACASQTQVFSPLSLPASTLLP